MTAPATLRKPTQAQYGRAIKAALDAKLPVYGVDVTRGVVLTSPLCEQSVKPWREIDNG